MGMHLNYRWKVTTLTPLHVGSGAVLQEGFDFISHAGRLWVANQKEIFKAVLPRAGSDPLQAAKRLAGTSLGQMLAAGWLSPGDINLENGLFYYALDGQTSTANHEGLLHALIKNIRHQPYLPGSSLKGALRSALLRAHADRRALAIDYKHSRQAARFIENAAFVPNESQRQGKAPNFSLWRAVKIADSQPLASEILAFAKVSTFPMAQKDSPEKTQLDQDFEVLAEGAVLETLFQVEQGLFRRAVPGSPGRDLDFTSAHLGWFTGGLAAAVNSQAKARLSEEKRFFENLEKEKAGRLPFEIKTTLQALDQLETARAGLAENEMLLPVGRGTGWLSKTLGSILQDELDKDEFKYMVNEFNLGRGSWVQEDYIPYTRMLSTCGQQVRVPMGWVKIVSTPEEP